MTPSELKLVLAKLNWSAEFQISEPPPVTVQKALLYEAEPAIAGEPISVSVHPGGSAAHADVPMSRRIEIQPETFWA